VQHCSLSGPTGFQISPRLHAGFYLLTAKRGFSLERLYEQSASRSQLEERAT
jgi:hypothetical protein